MDDLEMVADARATCPCLDMSDDNRFLRIYRNGFGRAMIAKLWAGSRSPQLSWMRLRPNFRYNIECEASGTPR